MKSFELIIIRKNNYKDLIKKDMRISKVRIKLIFLKIELINSNFSLWNSKDWINRFFTFLSSLT